MNAVGMWKVTSTTFSASSSVSINNCFSADYANYKVVITNYGSASGFTRWRLRAGGSDASGGNYFRYGYTTVFSSGSLTVYNGGSETAWVPATSYGGSAGAIGVTELFIANPFQATVTTTTTNCNDGFSASSYVLNGAHNLSTSYDGFTVYPNSGTITGTITVYGMR
jgi:hypothetical protein